MEVLVTGGAGYVGKYVLRAMQRAGHRVTALVRSEASGKQVAEQGARALLGDAAEEGPWLEQARRADAIVHLACPSPHNYKRAYAWAPFSGEWVRAVDQFEARALPLLFAAAQDNPRCRALVTTTGPAAAGHHEADWIDEEARGPVSAFGEVQRRIEDRTLAAARAGLPALVIRPGAVYGPDGGFASRVLRDAKRGRVVFVGRGDNFVSWVHIEDYAEAYVRALDGAAAGKVIAVVDDAPTTSRASMELLASLTSARPPKRVPGWLARVVAGPVVFGWATQSARVRNSRATELLGWQPRFRSVQDGFAAVLQRFAAA